MNAGISPFQVIWKSVGWLLRFIVLGVLYFALFAIGGQIVEPYLPNITAEPGPLPLMTALLVSSVATTLVIMFMIHSSRWHGWKLMTSMSVAYYIVVTFVTQIESWYFLYGIAIGPELMRRLFLQGVPVAFVLVPLAVIIMGRARPLAGVDENPEIAPMPLKEWLWKIGLSVRSGAMKARAISPTSWLPNRPSSRATTAAITPATPSRLAIGCPHPSHSGRRLSSRYKCSRARHGRQS